MHKSYCLLKGEPRTPGWEDRFFAVMAEARSKPYKIGEHDCFRLACAVVHALTGVDLWAQWAGKYRSERAALKLIATFSKDFTRGASRLFGSEPSAMPFARRGDLCEAIDERGKQHLGVLIGALVAVLGETGFLYVPRERCVHCWRIG